MESNLEPYIYYIILGFSVSYIYRAIKQIVTKDITFYRQEIYTDESVEKWAVRDGLIKAFIASVCAIYGALCLLNIKTFWYVIVCAVADIVLYFVGYKVTLVRKESPDRSQE